MEKLDQFSVLKFSVDQSQTFDPGSVLTEN